MKKLFVILFICLTNLHSQNVAINTTGAAPNISAGLDIDYSDKGLLVPRVALSATNNNSPIGASIATSLLIYNTATASSGTTAVTPGYYYWDGSLWQRLQNTTAWQINGNSGTNPSTNFVGTTDFNGLAFRTVNVERMRINENGHVGINLIPNSLNRLQIAGNVSIGSSSFVTSYVSPTNGMLIEGKLGVGHTTVASGNYLDVAGGSAIGRVFVGGVNAPSNGLLVQGSVTFSNNTFQIADSISAKLNVFSNNQGVLLPRVALTSKIVASPVTSPANSLLVFNTATAGSSPNNVFPGYYYWNSSTSQWVRLLTELDAFVKPIRRVLGSNVTVLPTDYTIIAEGSYTVTLPNPTTVPLGRIYVVKIHDCITSPLSVSSSGGATINGSSTLLVSGAVGYDCQVTLQSDGVNWVIISD